MSPPRAVPVLPCASLDDAERFAAALGFGVVHRREQPEPYLVLRDDDGIEVHYAEVPGLAPDDSVASCLVVVPDPRAVYERWAAGLRARYGELPTTGVPRVVPPRGREGDRASFTVVDVGGSWWRVVPERIDAEEPITPGGPLRRALARARVLGDDEAAPLRARAALRAAWTGAGRGEPEADRREAATYLAELARRCDDEEDAREWQDVADRIAGGAGPG
ncbi:VOC family protein [Nocardioides sp. SYSU D00038]|uniref:VOC family protein n=1 Tax=Nocardioides sp. SYSU D00038 TaxID=2812554 RepID=UPI0019678A9F|nr:VOC family protein [Nocardioides sp. SYSU D00038]